MPSLHITPRINSDNSVTLNMNIEEPTMNLRPLTPNEAQTSIRTLKSGEMTAYDVTQQLPPCGNRVFLFVTPTILSASPNKDNITVKP